MKRKFAVRKNAETRLALVQAVAVVMGVVSQVNAADAATLYGGGATLPAAAYEGGAAALSTSRLAVTGTGPSLFGQYFTVDTTNVSYCQTGSGTGKRVLGGFSGYSAASLCGDFSGTPLGFSGPAGVATPDFAASDAPLAQSEYSSVIASFGTTRGEGVQFPSVAGVIAIVYNNPDHTANTLDLSKDSVCKVFAGQVTNWNQLTNNAGTNLGLPSHSIIVVVRSDGSGTSFSFSNYLSANCGTSVSGHFNTDQAYTTNVVSSLSPVPGAGFFTAVSGNPGVVTEVGFTTSTLVTGTQYTMGYAELADALARTDGNIDYALVSGKNPASSTDFPATFTISTTTGQVITGFDATGRPTLAAATGGTHAGSCLVMAVPNSYATPAGYPIVAVTNLLGYFKGNGATKAPLIQDLLGSPMSDGILTRGSVTTIGAGKGFSWLFDQGNRLTSATPIACVTS